VDIADPARPKVLRQISVPKGTHSHKVQLADGLLLANHEQYPYRVGVPESTGLLVYDVTMPADPRQIGFLPIDGLGVHRIWYTGAVVYSVGGDGALDLISSLSWAERSGGHPHTHTALPLGDRKLLVVTDEAIEPDCKGARKDIHLVDISDETRPKEISRFPVP